MMEERKKWIIAWGGTPGTTYESLDKKRDRQRKEPVTRDYPRLKKIQDGEEENDEE
jgi:hypothetical protein